MPRVLDPARRFLVSLRDDEAGVTSIEYALIALFIALVIITAVQFIGTSVKSIFMTVGSGL